jgi:hypothetical protein
MNFQGLILACAVFGAGASASVTACTGPDPSAITFSERPGEDAPADPPEGSSTSSGSSGEAPPPGGEADPIFGATTLQWTDPGLVANTQAIHGGPVEGKDCVVAGCHLGGTKPWLMGGTIYNAAQNGTTVAKAEIRIVGPDGAEVAKAYTDANGNYWLGAAEGVTIPANSKVGVRREGGAGTKMMATALGPTDSGCNANRANCHGTAATGKVFVP